MIREGTPFRPLPYAQIDWRDQLPVSRQFGDIYYSAADGLGESSYTFLEGNRLAQRLSSHEDPVFCIGETGFGTGLNFLLSWRAWQEAGTTRPYLSYLSVEQHPLSPRDLQRALDNWPELAPYARALLAQYPPPLPGRHRLLFQGGAVRLDLCWGEAGATLQELSEQSPGLVDAWYLDGFAPEKNANMWEAQLLHSVARLSRPGASASTFTAAGAVRRALVEAGFEVRKEPGYGRKREALRATFSAAQSATPAPAQSPWDLAAVTAPRPPGALVVGAGLAGCFAADALARRGVQVTVIDQGAVAAAASGNEQGILYTRLSRRHSALTDFALQSFSYATRLYAQLFALGHLREGIDGALCGNFQQVREDDQALADIGAALAQVPELAEALEAASASARLGIGQDSGGFWYPRAGWLHPGALCTALLGHENIRLMEHCGPVQLERHADGWRAVAASSSNASATCLASAPCAVLATGAGSPGMRNLEWLPLRAIRGQTTQLPTSPALAQLQAGFCHEGYIAPARDGRHTIGATFSLQDDQDDIRDEDHRQNLDNLAAAVPAWAAELNSLDTGRLQGRVGYRCASPDYLPVVGPVPEPEAFCRTYEALRRNAKSVVPERAPCLEGLFLSTAHGSRGLTSTPLSGELLAALICGETPPLERPLSRALSPARFLARDLARGRR